MNTQDKKEVAHLDHPGHRHDGTDWGHDRGDHSGQDGVGHVLSRHDGEGCGMTGADLPEGRPADTSTPRGVPGPLRWVLSPLDYRAHVLVEGDQPVGVVAARCGVVLGVGAPGRVARTPAR